ncbi:hypothetical protein [Lysobacter gummosus]|uniref:hypothetical protein n=1 Tax=Lysobacter gummosus TaxID=262324 RepID=UPI0036304597
MNRAPPPIADPPRQTGRVRSGPPPRIDHGAPDLDRNPVVRTAQHPGQADDRRAPGRSAFPHARQP